MKHRFASAKANGADGTLVQPSNWNDLHNYGVTPLSANTTIDSTYDFVPCTGGASGITITLPTAVGNEGMQFTILKEDSAVGTVIVDGNASETINGDTTYTINNQYDLVHIVARNGNWVISDKRNGFALDGVQVLTSGTTYTPSANTKAILVECVGGGGGGGGALGGSSLSGFAGGGGSGAYARKFILVTPGQTFSYAIGAAGTAGATTPAAGGTGGTTTFGTGPLISCPGGAGGASGGTAASSVLVTAGGAGGAVATGGDENSSGTAGEPGMRLSGTIGCSGTGGASMLGGGSAAVVSASTAGNAGGQYGGGGSGAGALTTTGKAGGAGAAGVIVVLEYK